jgi:hypothetical protein
MHTFRSLESCVLSEGVGIRLLYQQLNTSGKAVLPSILSSENGICGIWKGESGLFAACIVLAAKSRFGLRVAEALILMSKHSDSRPREAQRHGTLAVWDYTLPFASNLAFRTIVE